MKIGTLDNQGAGRIDLMAPRISATIRLERIDYGDDQPSDDAPSHRIVTTASGNTVEVGAAWTKKQKDGRTYLSCQIDQPGYPAPVPFAAFGRDDGGWDLNWSRKKIA